MTKAQKIRNYFTEHPEAFPSEIAKKFGVTPAYVYLLRGKLNAKKAQAPKEGDWVTAHVVSSDKSFKEHLEEAANKVSPTAAPTTDVDATLAERGKRYGTFVGHAEVTIALKDVIGAALATRQKMLAPDQKEAIAMICHKIGRIVNGDPDYADSWIDIAGYAKLVADRLETGKEV